LVRSGAAASLSDAQLAVARLLVGRS
jgi:hypothetical protein